LGVTWDLIPSGMATDEIDFSGEPKSYPCKALESKRAFAKAPKYLELKTEKSSPVKSR
jgi:hypothetical protein